MLVYMITNVKNGKRYVGKTTMTLEARLRCHFTAANSIIKRAKSPLAFAIRKHGREVFKIEEIERCDDAQQLRDREIHWIAELKTFAADYDDGYNATLGGEGIVGYRHTEDTKRRMGEARKGEKNCNYGKQWGCKWDDPTKLAKFAEKRKGGGNPMFGKHHKEEARKKIGEAQFKQVMQYDLEGNQIAIFNSVLEAEQITNVGKTGISRACRFPQRSAGGYKWQYLLQSTEKEKV